MVSLAEASDSTIAGDLKTEDTSRIAGDDRNPDEMVIALRREAFTWPRLVAPPMKRSGHVIMDACCSNGVLYPFRSLIVADMPARTDPTSHLPQIPFETRLSRRTQSPVGRPFPIRAKRESG